MGAFRTVENGFILPLSANKLVVREGVDSMVYGKIWAAHKREYGEESAQEVIDRLKDIGPNAGEAVHFLGRKATLHALASFSYQQSPIDSAQRRFDYARYYEARGAERVNNDTELAFINAAHYDLRAGLLPYGRRYEKAIWTSVDAGDFARRALYERAGYSHDGVVGDEVIMVHST